MQKKIAANLVIRTGVPELAPITKPGARAAARANPQTAGNEKG